jgi:GH24 family phage-related lysozyme (muramidase)
MALAFAAVQVAALLAAGALRQLGANMIGGGAGGAASSAAGAVLPGVGAAAGIATGTFVAYEALTAADRQRAKSDAESKARKEGKSPQEIARAGQEAYDRAGENQNQEFLGAMDESNMGSAIMEASGGKRDAATITNPRQPGYNSEENQKRLKELQGKATQAKSDTSKPLTPTQISGVQSETKKFLGKNTAEYLAAKEGFSSIAYLDPPGNTKNQYSIGHGHLIQPQEIAQGYILLADGKKLPVSGIGGKDTKITKEQAKLLLQSDLPKYEKLAADPLGPEAWAKLNDDQKTALISYAYNTGSTASLVRAGLKDAILKGDMEKAAEIISSKGIKTALGKFHSGLEARRFSESALFAGGQFNNTPGAESPTMLATNKTSSPDTPSKPKSMIESVFDQLVVLDKYMGGALNLSSINVNDLIRDFDKQAADNPMFIDNSNKNISNGGAPESSAVAATAWNKDILDAILARQYA